MHYQYYTTTREMTHFQTRFVNGSHWNISINSNIPHNISPHTIQSMYFGKAPHFSTETHGNAILPHKVREEKAREPKGELIRLSDVISND